MSVTKRKPQARRQAVLVLGMHRSGTSALGGVLAHLGAQAPRTLMEATKDNPNGYWESTEFKKINDRILSSAGSRWNDWGQFNPQWYKTAVADQFRESLAEVIKKEFGDAPFMLIKDPRICRFLPLWLDVLESMNIQPKVVIQVRHPVEVAQSLQARDHFGRSRSFLLWLRHFLDAEAGSRALARTFVSYEGLLSDWRSQARKISLDLDFSWPKWSGDTEAKISEFLSAQHRHQIASGATFGEGQLSGWVDVAYNAASMMCSTHRPETKLLAELDDVRQAFDQSSETYAAVVREHETRVEGLYASVKARLGEQTAKLEALAQEHREVEGRIAEGQVALAEKEVEAASYARNLAESKEALQRLHDDHRRESTALVSKLTICETELEGMKSEKKLLLCRLDESNEQLRADRQEHALAIRDQEAKAEALVAQIQSQLQTQLDEAAGKLADHSERLADSEGLRTALEANFAATHAALNEANKQLDLRAAEYARLEEAHAELVRKSAQETNALTEQVSDLRGRLELAESSIDSRYKETARLTRLLLDLEESSRRQSEIDARKISLLEFNLAIRTNEGKSLGQSIEVARYELSALKSSRSWRLTRFLRSGTSITENSESSTTNDLDRQELLLSGSDYFDADWYLRTYGEVGSLGCEPVQHYLRLGAALGYNPGPRFDTVDYLARYPDVRQLAMNPLLHYVEYGQAEHRIVSGVNEAGK